MPALPEVTREASGAEALALTTRVLNAQRLADPDGGVWEAADVQWWSRTPRASDALPQRFWCDGDEPVATALVTAWSGYWWVDVLAVPDAPVDLARVWSHGLRMAEDAGATVVESLVDSDDEVRAGLLEASGFASTGPAGGVLRASAGEQVPTPPLPDGYRLTDRAERPDAPHPMVARNGPEVGERLARCPLYDPALDLAVLAPDGGVAGYALLWNDLVTGVGLVEPVRVEDEHSRRGIARAMVGAGLERLVAAGSTRLQVGWQSEAAFALYTSLGFRDASRQVLFRRTSAG